MDEAALTLRTRAAYLADKGAFVLCTAPGWRQVGCVECCVPFAGFVDGRTLKGCWWNPGDPGTRKRKAPPRAFVWHWTGGGNPAETVCRTLRNRRNPKTGKPEPLSVHYVLDLDGRLVQCADPAGTVCYHAGTANEWSVGCEIVGGPGHDFTPAQYAKIGELADASGFDRRVWMPGDNLATFRGHLEHRNVTSKKPDAGGRVLAFLAKRWGLVA